MGLAQADSTLKAKLEAMLPGMTVESMEPLEDTGLYEAVVDGELVYFSKDGRYLFQGDVIALESRQNITENKRIGLKKKVLASLNEDDMWKWYPC